MSKVKKLKTNRDITEVFFALLKAGLWEQNIQLSVYETIDFTKVLTLAEEQSVVGLIAAGLEHIEDRKPAKQEILEFIGQALQIEQQNNAMNYFIGMIVDKMRKAGIYTLLVKGQSVAKCYERPLWRSCGDVDFFLSDDNYIKAQNFLKPLALSCETESEYTKHIGMIINPWVVELHGSLRCGLSYRMDKTLDYIYHDTFYGGNVRFGDIGGTQVFMLSLENDIVFVFSHFLKHFYKGGLGVRQICDWCRIIYYYRERINEGVLETLIRDMRLMSEWKAFAAFSVVYLGAPETTIPFYDNSSRWRRKAKYIKEFILKTGNMGNKRDSSFYDKYPYVMRKLFAMMRRLEDLIRHMRVFPVDSLRFIPSIFFNGIKSAIKGEG